ncbi:hypothetical protein BsWGS_09669 [Bradybaena similaris]
MNLDLVLGISCRNISCLACDQNSSLVAHTASGVLVLLDTATNCQVRYLHLRQNAVSTVSFSPDGKLIVTGEIGYRPAVRVWRVKDGQEIAALYGHEFGIKSVLFLSNMTQIVSVGLEHDNIVNLWAWPERWRIATNKIVDIIKAVAYSESGGCFVTAGIRHIKFWYPEMSLPISSNAVIPPVQCLYGRPGLLGECKHHTFVDVACGNGSSAKFVYCITKLGGLVTVKSQERVIHSHKSIEELKANCLKVQDQILFIGFSSGDVHMFNAITLIHIAALPAPTYFRQTCMNGSGVFTLVFNPSTTLLVTAYNNCSMCVWDLKEASNVKQRFVAVYHSKAITNIDIFTSRDSKGQVRETLVTVSHDSTVRLWGIVFGESICYDRLSILYTDPAPLQPILEAQSKTLDNAGIITAVKVSPDRKYIVTGNQAGNICVYDRVTFEHSLTVLAHNREVTCLAIFTDSAGRSILASGSRDRLIHIMDVNRDFRLISTLNIHSSSITVITFCEMSGLLNMISCSADRTLSLCSTPVTCDTDNSCAPMLQLSKCTTIMSTPTDICFDSFTQQIPVGCQDGYIRILDIDLLQERRMFRGCSTEERQILKLCLDSRGILLLSAASDKTINVINFATGDILISMTGHTKFVTGLIFTSSGDHVISTSMDGCVFIWHISEKALMKRLHKSKKQNLQDDEYTMKLAHMTDQSEFTDKAVGGTKGRHSPRREIDSQLNSNNRTSSNLSETCYYSPQPQKIYTRIRSLTRAASDIIASKRSYRTIRAAVQSPILTRRFNNPV